MLTCVQGQGGGCGPAVLRVGEGPWGHPGGSGRGGAGGTGTVSEAQGSIRPAVPLWSSLVLLDIDPGRPLVDSLIEN